jgi:hypothetical protein
MRHLLSLRRKPSAAMVVAIIALVVAASGTAVAATKLVSGDSLIKKNSLSGNRLRNRSVQGSKIKLGSLGTVPSAKHASTADTATNSTNATNATNASSASISKVTYVSTTVPVDTSSSTTAVTAITTCPAGTIVTGGGASVADNTAGFVNASYPNAKTGWTAAFFSSPATTGTVYAICAPAATTAP